MADLRKQINQGITTARSQAGFGTSVIPQHRHNGNDSPKIRYSDLTGVPVAKIYGGAVSDSGVALTPFPKGWSVSRSSTGLYNVTHNLNTTNYVVIANAMAVTPTNDIVFGVLQSAQILANSFQIWMVNYNSNFVGTAFDSAFNFLLFIQE